MRLICPNCNAQYEVDEAAIPEAGRDVQCSSCGHTWFQESAATLREREVAEAAVPPPPPPSPPEPEPEPEPTGLTRRKPDESVLNVLREEAAREAEARRAEGTSLEMQEDFGPMTPPEPPPPPAQPVEDDDAPDPAVVPRASRRELLPDIEEINSTLRPTSERGDDAASYDAPETRRRERSGFRRGFLTSVAIMVLALLPYVYSEPIARAVPALESALGGYSDAVNSVRLWLDETLHRATAGMKPKG
ncbi:zinc-ribbon domain-containing protein [Frigidibacter sp. RF13]|uniref:zinc-ribbon domain-containing protein n=1 Tax=Frigidibacter sp. RF13 TaxID=2997340 RepID=UPI00227069BC|nr:zinc-ribbon domain-containing protein [Frigidibacter sp. RF13]MCY1128681.1 zinc-ribbon domain-containing protein [Frigidibacter sp. RF13]